jgi:hypothetical protein
MTKMKKTISLTLAVGIVTAMSFNSFAASNLVAGSAIPVTAPVTKPGTGGKGRITPVLLVSLLFAAVSATPLSGAPPKGQIIDQDQTKILLNQLG